MSGAKVIALLVTGLLVGVMGTSVMMSAWQQRGVLPKGTMALMESHLTKARRAASGEACDLDRARHHLQRIDALSTDAIDIFTALGTDNFPIEQRAFARVVTQAIDANDCTALGTGIKMVADACDACHHNNHGSP